MKIRNWVRVLKSQRCKVAAAGTISLNFQAVAGSGTMLGAGERTDLKELTVAGVTNQHFVGWTGESHTATLSDHLSVWSDLKDQPAVSSRFNISYLQDKRHASHIFSEEKHFSTTKKHICWPGV